MALEWIKSIRKTDNCVLYIDLGEIKVPDNFHKCILWTADNHRDNRKNNSKLEDHHLSRAILEDWGIINLGDLHCAMQGKDDPRSSKPDLHPDLKSRAYWDRLTDFMVAEYGHVADRWIAQLYGNHEMAIINNNELDLIQRFAACMNTQHSGIIETLGYSGFIKISAKVGGGSRVSKTYYGTHGHVAGGKSTQGVSALMRQNLNIDGIDGILCGHTHNSYHVWYVKEYLNQRGIICERNVDLIQIPTYKAGMDKARLSWEAQRGIGAKPMGAWLMHIRAEHKGQLNISWELLR